MPSKLLSAAICVALGGIATAPLVFAQDAATAPDEEVQRLDSITVTGSRISNPNVLSPAPVSTLTAEAIQASGAVNIGDLLTTMPQLATTFTMGNSTRFIGTAGVAQQDLRNLGPARTLVLVNGRRMIGASSGSSAVDTNLIPIDWVDRVEIITGGASAVYGADAVSGVINFILKKNYQGLNLHAQYGNSQHGHFDEKFLAVTGGKNFAEDRGNFAVSLEHSRQDALEFRDRFGNQAFATIRTPGGPTDAVLMPDAGSFLFTDGGTFTTAGLTDLASRFVFNPDGSFRPQRFDGITDNAGACSNCDRSDGNQTVQLQPKYDRTTLSAIASFDLNQDHRLYFEGLYNLADSKAFFAPTFGSATTGNAHLIQPDNAFITPELAALTGGEAFEVSRNDVDAGRRGESTERQTGRVVFGIEGNLSSDWQYDASVIYGRVHERRENLNNRVLERFYAGLDAVVDPATGNIVCRSTIDPTTRNEAYFRNSNSPDGIISPEVAANCVPFSVFGEGAIDPAAAAFFNTTTITKTRLTQFVAGGSLINNDLFELPAGPLSFGTGVEYRRETSRQENDPLDVSGQTFLNAIPSSGGEYNVKEIWAEVAVPILSDLPLIKSLSVGAAARYSDYDIVGSTEAWRYNLDWAINDSLRIRGNMSAAVRAPNIDELFSGQAQNFNFINDPCDVNNIGNTTNPDVRRANCAALGVPADHVDTVLGTNEGISGSNPDLEPETGRSWTAGFVFTPSFLPGFGLNVDYWEIRLTDAIAAVAGQGTADRCVDSPSGIDNVFCSNITRDPVTHQITFFRSLNENIAAIETDGIDIGVYYSHNLAGGTMRWDLNATRVLSYDDFPFQDDPDEAIDSNGTLGFPEWKAVLRVDYSRDNWGVNWTTRYVSDGLRVTNESFEANPTSTTPIKAGSGVVHDIRGSYTFLDSGLQVYAGVTNVFDSDPPVNLFGTGFGSALYDTIGRAYYLGINYKFF